MTHVFPKKNKLLWTWRKINKRAGGGFGGVVCYLVKTSVMSHCHPEEDEERRQLLSYYFLPSKATTLFVLSTCPHNSSMREKKERGKLKKFKGKCEYRILGNMYETFCFFEDFEQFLNFFKNLKIGMRSRGHLRRIKNFRE